MYPFFAAAKVLCKWKQFITFNYEIVLNKTRTYGVTNNCKMGDKTSSTSSRKMYSQNRKKGQWNEEILLPRTYPRNSFSVRKLKIYQVKHDLKKPIRIMRIGNKLIHPEEIQNV